MKKRLYYNIAIKNQKLLQQAKAYANSKMMTLGQLTEKLLTQYLKGK